jgi:hypothetical protein
MIHKINVSLLSIFIALFPAFSYAVYDIPAKPTWLPAEEYKIESLRLNMQAMSEDMRVHRAYMATVNGSRLYAQSEAVVTATASEVGQVMNDRISKFARGGGTALVGVIAVEALLEGIGWVMKEGTYVKMKDADFSKTELRYYYGEATNRLNKFCYNAQDCKNLNQKYFDQFGNHEHVDSCSSQYGAMYCSFGDKDQPANYTMVMSGGDNPSYEPNAPQQTIPITPEQIGCAIYHTCYHDPVDSSKDTSVNTGIHDSNTISDAATRQEGEDNPLVSKIDKALEDAPKTPTSSGTEGKSDSTTTTKDQTGNTTSTSTSNSTFKLPAFCDYATKLCDWMDWTQKPDLPEKEPMTPDQDQPVDEKKVAINFGSQCPQSRVVPFEIEGQQADIKVVDYEPICAQAAIIKPSIIFSATLAAALIIFGRRSEND